jgi:hypothetical protein
LSRDQGTQDRVPTKPFRRLRDISPKQIIRTLARSDLKREGTSMNTIVANVLKRKAREAQPRFKRICFLTAVTVAMIGWLSAFGWLAVAVANWVSA